MSCSPASSTRRQTPVYSLSWASSIVKRALKEHGRVSVDFLEATGLSPELLAKLLSLKRPEWVLARDMLKYIDLCQEPPSNTPTLVKFYLKRFAYRFPIRFHEYLTNAVSKLE